jgi:ceramide glucosyltransferase
MSRDLGRQDCLGATMALRRETLESIGGFAALVDHLADDNVLGRLVRNLGLRIKIAATVPATTVPEADFGALWRHELRWSRTILSLVPLEFALSSIQFPLAWALLAWAVSGAAWAGGLFVACWAFRGLAVRGIDRALGLVSAGHATAGSAWLLPARDIFSIFVILASYMSDSVEWRGQMMHTRSTELPESDATSDTIRTAAPQGTMTT